MENFISSSNVKEINNSNRTNKNLFENNKEDYYITEKICNGFFSGIIPVYWGSPNIYEYFNSNRFLYLKDDSDQQINSIIERMINMDDTTYLNMIHSPILVNNDLINPLVQNIQSILF